MRTLPSLLKKFTPTIALAAFATTLLANTPVVPHDWLAEDLTDTSVYSGTTMPSGPKWTIPADDDSTFTEGSGIALDTGDDPIVYTPKVEEDGSWVANPSQASLPVELTFNVQFASATELPEIPDGAQVAVTAASVGGTAAYYAFTGTRAADNNGWTQLSGATPVAEQDATVVVTVDYEAQTATIKVGSTLLSNGTTTSLPFTPPSGVNQVTSLAFAGTGILSSFSGKDSRAAVASVGNTNYETLAAAFAAAGNGDTVTLLADVSLTDRLFVNAGATPAYAGANNRYATTTANNAITLDLNGKNITSSSNIALAGGSLNITGTGTITTTNAGLAPIEVRGTGDLTSKRTLTIGPNVTLSGSCYGLNVFGSNDAQQNAIDVTVNGTVNGMLFVLGNLTNTGNAINIVVNGIVDASSASGEEAVHTGIAQAGYSTVTVNNGAIVTGESGIETRAGSLVVNGGTITATATPYSYTANGSGMTTKGAAIAIAQHGTALPTSATLNGGTLSGAKDIGVTDVNGNMSTVTVLAAQGYTENANIPAGYSWVETETSGVYTLSKVWTVSFVNSKGAAPAAQSVVDGGTATAPADPAPVEGYTFNGWFAPNAESAFVFTTPITADLELTADWTVNSHMLTITYVVPSGFTAPDNHSRAYDYGAPYSVASPPVTGCTPDIATVTGTMGDADVPVTVTYTANKYTVTWIADGSEFAKNENVAYGTSTATLKPANDPTKASSDTTDYAFKDWGTLAETVTADATYTATWTESARKYTLTITYVGPDGFPAQETYTAQVANGTQYSVASPTVEGYTPDPATVTGTMPTQDYDVTVTYTADAPATVLSIALNTNAVGTVANGTLAATAVSGTNITVQAVFSETPTSEVTASPNGTVTEADGVYTVTFAGAWNAATEWSIDSGAASLKGKTYVKGETEWFKTNAADVVEVSGLNFGTTCSVGVKPANATVPGEAVRIETRIAVTAAGSESAPATTDVGDARGGFSVVGGEYVAFDGTAWVPLLGAEPFDGEIDLLMVADMADASQTIRYYVDGVSLYTTNNVGAPLYAVPMKTVAENATVLNSVGFSSASIVKAPVVAEYDVSYVPPTFFIID